MFRDAAWALRVRSPRFLAERLHDLLSSASGSDVFHILDWIEVRLAGKDPEALAIAAAAALSKIASVDPETAWRRWKAIHSRRSLDWTPRD